MQSTRQTDKTALQRIWAWGCSLKVAIYLASAATLLIMVGSLLMHFNPRVFGGMEEQVMGRWLPTALSRAPLLAAWLPLTALCVLLFAINTCCCTIDWLLKFKARWRKTGEYLIHTGFILLVIAYLWGSLAGFRSGPYQLFPGETTTIAGAADYSLRLDSFEAELAQSGQPLDMLNRVTLLRDNKVVRTATVSINHPLLHDGLIVLSSSFGREINGFLFYLPGAGPIKLTAGSRLELSPGLHLSVQRFLSDARRDPSRGVVSNSSRLGNPALLLALDGKQGRIWDGWYFLRGPLPRALQEHGVLLRPVEPSFRTYSLLTINRDPGGAMALLGAILIGVGVLFAFFSFYRKRATGDRPEL